MNRETRKKIVDTLKTAPAISDIKPKKRPKGKKRERGKDLILYKKLLEKYDECSKKIPSLLLRNKSYLLEKYNNEKKSVNYLLNYFGISEGDAEQRTMKELLAIYNKYILSVIGMYKVALDEIIPFLFNDTKVPQRKKWFVDVFGNASERYLPNWREYKSSSHNKPDFGKSYKDFKKFIKGATPADLGFVYTRNIDTAGIAGIETREKKRKNKYHILRYRTVPQGLIVFLWLLHQILYGVVEDERTLLKEKLAEIKQILKDVSEIEALQILHNIHSGFPDNSGFTYPLSSPIHWLRKPLL